MDNLAYPTIDVVAAVIHRDNSLFICKRPYYKTHGGLWEFPGGKVHEGESFEDALGRELYEELGLMEIEMGVELYRGRENGSPYLIRFFEVIANENPRLHEHIDSRWVEPQVLATYALAPVDRSFVEHVGAWQFVFADKITGCCSSIG